MYGPKATSFSLSTYSLISLSCFSASFLPFSLLVMNSTMPSRSA